MSSVSDFTFDHVHVGPEDQISQKTIVEWNVVFMVSASVSGRNVSELTWALRLADYRGRWSRNGRSESRRGF